MKNSTFNQLGCVALVAAISCGPLTAHEQDGGRTFDMLHNTTVKEGHLHASWESRYMSEGRDNLNGDSLITTSAEFGWKFLTAGVWYGGSPDQSYNELLLSAALTHSTGDFVYYLAYTHVQSPDNPHEFFGHNYDNEVGAGVAWSGLPVGLELTVDGYYSFLADGSFWELGLNREFELSECLTLSGAGLLGVNQGYIADGHDGMNHVAVQLELQYAVTDTITLNGNVGYSWAIDQDTMLSGDELLLDTFHGGVGMQWAF